MWLQDIKKLPNIPLLGFICILKQSYAYLKVQYYGSVNPKELANFVIIYFLLLPFEDFFP